MRIEHLSALEKRTDLVNNYYTINRRCRSLAESGNTIVTSIFILFLAFCESDVAALFFEDVTSSCLCNFTYAAPLSHVCCASHAIPFDVAFICDSCYVAKGKGIVDNHLNFISCPTSPRPSFS